LLEITFYRDGAGRFAGFGARGHADFAEYGQDIVCAAVSAILQAARLGLEHYAAGEIEATQEPGSMRVVVSEGRRDDESIAAIGTTADLSVTQVVRRFADHVSIVHETIEGHLKRGASFRVSNVANDQGE
jgi:uncharacterized protein YsxB (DUF464 family)